MSITFQFYTDAALTAPLSGPLVFQGSADVGAAPIDHVLYFGSTAANTKAQANSAPGAAQIQVALTAADSGLGNAANAADIKLALTQAGLAGAVGGAALNIGVTLNSGSANAVAVWIRDQDSTHLGRKSFINLQTSQISESGQ